MLILYLNLIIFSLHITNIQAASAERLIEDTADVNQLYHQATLYEHGQYAEGQERVPQVIVPKDKARAHALYEQAAEKGHAESMYRLGLMHSEDRDSSFWPSVKWTWYQRAAEAGHADAQCKMGFKYLSLHDKSKQDLNEAKKWLIRSATQNNLDAPILLGGFLPGEEGFRWALRAAQAGDPDAKYITAQNYLQGRGTEINVMEGIRWLEEAVETDHDHYQDSIFQLALLAEDGVGGLTIDRAVELYRRGTDFADTRAAKKLGMLYEEGRGVEQNYVEAVNYYRQVLNCRAPNDDICYRLARIFEEEGVEGESNQEEAFKLYRRIKGYNDVNYRLGKMYEEGRGTPQDDVQAVAYYQAAAEAGHAEAQVSLERLREAGRGLTIWEQATTNCNIM